MYMYVVSPSKLTWLLKSRSMNSSSERGFLISSRSSLFWAGCAGRGWEVSSVSFTSNWRLALWSSILEPCSLSSRSKKSLCWGSGGNGVLWSLSLRLCDWIMRPSNSSSMPSLLGHPSYNNKKKRKIKMAGCWFFFYLPVRARCW